MVIVDLLLLVISMPSSLGFGFVSALSDTDPQIGSDGLMGVDVGIAVFVGVKAGVAVLAGAGVFVGRFVTVAVRVGFFVGVLLGNTTCVYVGGTVGEAVRVIVGVGIRVGVDVIALWISPCACASETGTISLGEQYCPVIVQAIVSSVPVSGSGVDGTLMDWVPFAPPN